METVQDTIERAMAGILHAPQRIVAAGRTDAGVHAYGQRFHADVEDFCRLAPANWLAALNAHLPPDIRVTEVLPVPPDFHARFSASGKRYEYLICRSAVLSPFLAGRAWHVTYPLDTGMLSRALSLYVGAHDFRRLSARRGNEPASPPEDFFVRRLSVAELHEQGEKLLLVFCGDGFMYRMVRMLVGSACRVASGRMELGELQGMVDMPQGGTTRFCAPAHGLYLREVMYPQL